MRVALTHTKMFLLLLLFRRLKKCLFFFFEASLIWMTSLPFE